MPKNRPLKITTSQILDAYANAIYNEDTVGFWHFIQEANQAGMLPISLKDVRSLIDSSHSIIQNNRYNLETSKSVSPSGRQTRKENK